MDRSKEICASLAESLQARLQMEQSLGSGFACVPPFVFDPVALPEQSAPVAPVDTSSVPAPDAVSIAEVDFTQKTPVEIPQAAASSSGVKQESASDHVQVHVMPVHTGSADKISAIEPLVNEALACKKCGLCEKRTQVVFGEGNLDAELVVVGQAPGRDDDIQGRPFAGHEGRFLEDVFRKGLKRGREEMYFTTVVKCRPFGNRDPKDGEGQTCLPYLRRQFEIIRPKAILAVGGLAASMLTGDAVSIEQLRGNWYEFEGIPLMPVYHTAFMVRMQRTFEATGDKAAGTYKRIFWEDLKLVCNRLGWEHA